MVPLLRSGQLGIARVMVICKHQKFWTRATFYLQNASKYYKIATNPMWDAPHLKLWRVSHFIVIGIILACTHHHQKAMMILGVLRRGVRAAAAPCATGARAFHRSVGIVGMPNVGKSTLFNALTRTENAQAANYPFCTIDPNVARVAVPDPRVHRLAEMELSQKVIETQLEFVDIAGLVRGASKGEGLGNKFLDNIRQVAVIAHVVRCFEDTNILHVDESVDPLRDLETIRSELILADLQTVEKRLANLAKKKKYVSG